MNDESELQQLTKGVPRCSFAGDMLNLAFAPPYEEPSRSNTTTPRARPKADQVLATLKKLRVASRNQIMEESGLTIVSVRKALERLGDERLIRCVKRGKGGSMAQDAIWTITQRGDDYGNV